MSENLTKPPTTLLKCVILSSFAVPFCIRDPHPCFAFLFFHLLISHSDASKKQKTVDDASQEDYSPCILTNTLEMLNSLCVKQKRMTKRVAFFRFF